ncbi:MAG: hypothetical protein R3E77_12160 [Steroidobacteraceae bacterium]
MTVLKVDIRYPRRAALGSGISPTLFREPSGFSGGVFCRRRLRW